MERRGCGLGCIIVGLGLLLSLCIAPYLISSIYAMASTLIQASVPTDWLWGDWLNTVVRGNDILYMLLAEGPICCVGALGLLVVVLGVVLMISGVGQEEAYELDEAYELEEQDLEEW
jgi:hypothetical protein